MPGVGSAGHAAGGLRKMSAVWAARGGFWKEKEGLDQQAEARTPGQHAQASFRTGTPATQVGGVSPPTLAGSTGIVSSMCWALLTSVGPCGESFMGTFSSSPGRRPYPSYFTDGHTETQSTEQRHQNPHRLALLGNDGNTPEVDGPLAGRAWQGCRISGAAGQEQGRGKGLGSAAPRTAQESWA